MMEAVRTSETSVDNYFTWQYIPEDNSELHTRRRENFKSHETTFSYIGLQEGVIYIIVPNYRNLNLFPFSCFDKSFSENVVHNSV
jgi:hypothetical protein